MHSDVHSSINSKETTCSQTFTLACSLACNHFSIHSSVQFDKEFKCKIGFNRNQINILSIIKNNHFPITYEKISEILSIHFETQLSPQAVRGIIQRLGKNKYIVAKRGRVGTIRGNYFTFTSKNCENIPMCGYLFHAHSSVQSNIYSNVHSSVSSFKIDKENLVNINCKDFSLLFPQLSKIDFGESQLVQIFSALKQQGKSSKNVLQGLKHAEWALKYNQLEHVRDYKNYIFKALSTHGDFQRPKNYLSPKEQQEQENEAKLKALQETEQREKEAKEEALRAQKQQKLQSWLNTLSEENKALYIQKMQHAYGGKLYPPDEVLLNQYFEKLVNSNLG